MIIGAVLAVELVLMIVLLWVAKRTSSRRVVRAGQFATLAELSQRGFGTDGLSELFDLAVSAVGRSLGVELVELLELQGKGGRLALRAGRGFRGDGVESEVLDLAHSFRVAHALDTGKPVIMGPGDQERRLYRDPWLFQEGVLSGITVAIPGRGAGFGTLGVHTRKKRRFHPEDTQFLEATASVLGIAIEGRQTELEARANQRNLAFLNEASSRLASAVGPGAVLEALSQVALPFLADFLLVDVRGEDGQLQRLVGTSGDLKPGPRAGDQGTSLLRQVPAGVDRADVPRARYASEATEDELQRLAADPEQLELLRGADLSSVMIVPLSAPNRVLGSVCFGARPPRPPYGPAEFALAGDLARRVAQALDKKPERAAPKTPVQKERSELDPRKGEFRAMLSLGLRDSIAALSNAIEVLRLTVGEDADARAIERAAGQVREMNRLVADLIDVSTHSRETIELHREPLELGALAQRAIESGRWAQPSRSQELELVLHDAPLWVDADPVRLEQIVATLIDRVRSGGPKRTIRIRIEAPPQEKWGIVRISEEDEGGSKTKARKPLPFEPSSAEPADLAVDLYLVHCLVKLHGGELSVHPGGVRGPTEFVVRFPSIPIPAWSSKRHLCDAEEASGLRVLLVDDHQELATGLAELLERWGHEARVAFDGTSGLEAARGFQPDLVLLDLGLPGMDGYEVAQALRREPSLSSVEVAALTGYTHADDRRRARDSGIDHYFTKPVDLAALRRLLERRAGKSHRSHRDLV
jgi:CheY-like chemotaxis protein/GAF domain-containing protein